MFISIFYYFCIVFSTFIATSILDISLYAINEEAMNAGKRLFN